MSNDQPTPKPEQTPTPQPETPMGTEAKASAAPIEQFIYPTGIEARSSAGLLDIKAILEGVHLNPGVGDRIVAMVARLDSHDDELDRLHKELSRRSGGVNPEAGVDKWIAGVMSRLDIHHDIHSGFREELNATFNLAQGAENIAKGVRAEMRQFCKDVVYRLIDRVKQLETEVRQLKGEP